MRLTGFLAAAGLALALTGCGHGPPAGPRIDPALAGLIPEDTIGLAGIRLESIEKTPVYQKFLAGRNLPEIDEFAKRTGVNPQKDLWELLLVSNGKTTAVLGHGMFSDEGEPKLQEPGDKRFGYKGFNLVGNDQNAILLINQTVLAIGDTNELKEMVDAHEKSAGPPLAMAGLLAKMPVSAQIWGAHFGPEALPFEVNGNLANINKILSLIQSGTLYLDLTMGVSGVAEGTSATDEAAEQLEGGLKALIGFGRLSTSPKQPELLRLWDGLRPTREGRVVKLHMDEPEELVETLVNLLLGKPK